MMARGEDRSSYQGVGPWTGLSFGFFKLTEGLSYTDPDAKANYENILKAGAAPGAYHFIHPQLSGEAQAHYFLDTAAKLGMDAAHLSFSADSEVLATEKGLTASPHVRGKSALLEVSSSGVVTPAAGTGLPMASLEGVTANSVTKAFMDEVVREHPWHARTIYTNLAVGDTLTDCGHYPLWFAYPAYTVPRVPHPWTHWTFWQWAWTGGYANCDRDVFDGDEAQLTNWLNSFKPPAPLPAHPHIVHWISLGFWSLAKEAEHHGTTPEEMLRCAAEAGHKYRPAMQAYVSKRDWNARLPHGVELFAPA